MSNNKDIKHYLTKLGIIFLTICFPPVGMYFIFKSNKFNNAGKIISGVYLVLFIAMFLIPTDKDNSISTDQPVKKEAKEVKKVQKNNDTSGLEVNEYIPVLVKQAGENYIDHVFADFNGYTTIKIETPDRQKELIAMDSEEILQRIFQEQDKVKTVALLWMDSNKRKVATIEMSRQTAERLDWDEIDYYDLKDIVEMAQ